jgi:hypothetical protein
VTEACSNHRRVPPKHARMAVMNAWAEEGAVKGAGARRRGRETGVHTACRCNCDQTGHKIHKQTVMTSLADKTTLAGARPPH